MLNAITRAISPNMDHCELTHFQREPINIQNAIQQHKKYKKVLEELGCKLISAPAVPDLPDSIFVEDCAIVLDELAIITHPGAPSRREEVKGIAEVLASHRKLFYIESPGIIDGGDVLVIGKNIWVGLSNRSNLIAIEQLKKITSPFGYSVNGVEVTDCLHLKSAVTQVEKNTVLLNPNWINIDIFKAYKIIEIHPDEPNAANALLINDIILFPKAYPLTTQILKDKGLQIINLDNSEVTKAEGALTCCSIIFKT
ncbi:MAG: dimethylarginine dimethylaminohydrolase family protein [Saprospiraceae bacterium]